MEAQSSQGMPFMCYVSAEVSCAVVSYSRSACYHIMLLFLDLWGSSSPPAIVSEVASKRARGRQEQKCTV